MPETDNGRLYILDQTRKDIFPSSPANCAHRRNYNRVEAGTHPEPLAVEDFYSKIESRAAPVLNQMRVEKKTPNWGETSKILDLIAIQISRTPRFRRQLEGQYFQFLEQEIMKMGRDEQARRLFAQRSRKSGLTEEFWTPEGYVARMKSSDFSIASDDNWKIDATMRMLPIFVKILQVRHWVITKFTTEDESLILSDAGVGFLSIGKSGPQVIGIALPSTIIYLPISPRLAFVGCHPKNRRAVERAVHPLILNTMSFALSLDQCFSSEGDFVIDDPERGPTSWTTYKSEGKFPKLFSDSGDLADDYMGSS